jgi:hypothetical protein
MAWQAAHPSFVRMAWLLPLGFTLLEVEQWNIVAFCQAQFPRLPATNAAYMRVTMFAGVLIGWLWTRAAMRARSARRAAFGILPFAAIGLLEALFHACATVYFRAYVPGTVMALTVLGPASFLLTRRAWRDGLVPRAYPVALAVLVLLDFGFWLIRPEVNLANKLEAGERIGAALARFVGQ